MFPRHVIFLSLFLGLLAGCNRSTPPASVSAGPKIMVETEAVSQGGHMRVVWVQSAVAGTADTAAQGKDLLLMGLDSLDDKGIRQLTPKQQNYFRPLITPSGKNVVFTERSADPHVFTASWDSGETKDLGTGVAVAVWQEPGTSNEWIYALEQIDEGARGGLVGKRVVRFQSEKPEDREIVWAQTPVDADGFHLSRDGRHASGLLPAPEACKLNFNDSTWKKLSSASWPAMAPDNSYVAWTLAVDRGELDVFAPNHPEPWAIPLSTTGAIGGPNTIWHPRWSNHVGIMVFTGPYPLPPNQPAYNAAKDGAGAEIFVARLGAGMAEVLSVVQITKNDRGDCYPDVWMENAFVENLVSFEQFPVDLPDEKPLPWPSDLKGVLFAFNQAATDVPLPAQEGTRLCRTIAKRSAKLGRFWDLDVSRGYFEADAESNQLIGNACKASNAFTLEAILTEARDKYQPLSVRLISYRQADGAEALGLYRVENNLIFRLRLGANLEQSLVYPVKLASFRIENDRPYHLVVTFQNQSLKTYIDGALVAQTSVEAAGLGGWTPGVLQLGDPQPMGGEAWTGSLEGVAVADRALTAEEVGKNFDAAKQKMKQRRPTDRVKLRAKLLEITPLPADAEQGPYTRILTSRTYAVEEVQAGVYEEKTIVVLHDAALNRKIINGLPDKIGASYTLLVEPSAQHPELKATQVINNTTALNLAPFVEVTQPKFVPDK